MNTDDLSRGLDCKRTDQETKKKDGEGEVVLRKGNLKWKEGFERYRSGNEDNFMEPIKRHTFLF